MPADCTRCGTPLKPGANFCGSCGTPAPAEDAAAVARYRQVLAGFAADGPLAAHELQQLETLRSRLGLAVATHERLLAELQTAPPAAARLRLAVDVAPMRWFEVGTRCMVRLQIHNDGDLALERLEVHAEVFGEQRLPPAAIAGVFPGRGEVLPLYVVPAVAGFQELRGVVHAVDLMGERSYLRFEGIQFRVGAASDAPRVSVVHIDQSSARVVDNSRSRFGAQAAETGGVVEEAEWRAVPLQAVSPAQAAELAPGLEAHKSAAAAPGARRGEPVRFSVKTDRARYEATTALAEGDIATVFGGRRTSDGARVALKIANARADNDLMQAEVSTLQLLRAEAGPQLKHLPVVLDQFETPDRRLATVFEYVDGYDLNTVRERLPGGVPARHIVWLMRRCLSVLGWAHSRGVLHGNLDPAHILVRPHDHNVWLVDWCWAVVNPAETGQTFRCVNDQFSPPEVEARKPPLPSSDLYSLGKCMIHAAGGDPAAKTLPDSMDEKLQRFIRFHVLESPLGRAQDAWQMYRQLDLLREEVFGPHQFVEFKLQ